MKIVITEKLNEIAKQYGSVTDFAKHVGLSRQTVGFYLSGKRMPDIVSLAKISKATGHTIDWLVFGTVECTNEKEKLLNNLKASRLAIESVIKMIEGGQMT